MSRFEDWEIGLIRALNGPLAFTKTPFADVAAALGVTEAQVLERVRAWKEDGTIRRFGARVNHRRLGFGANGMSVWNVPDEQVEAAAGYMSEQPEVSHCYARNAIEGFPYTHYSMIHGPDRDSCIEVAASLSRETGIKRGNGPKPDPSIW